MQNLADSRCGHLVPAIQGQYAYIPDSLPRELNLSPGLVSTLDKASRSVGTLAGVAETVPNPHLLSQPFVRREAVLSSRIEGTVASLSDVFAYESGGSPPAIDDVEEVSNYVAALQHGIVRLEQLPISLRLINEVHAQLLSGVRGQDKRPGELRREQVWIGPPGSPIGAARFVPPPPDYLRDLFYDWERFVNEPSDMPPLVRCALMHYQIEAIHPYLDGNGRIGRLLITLFLYANRILSTPLLYLSAYFERDRQKYYDELLNVSITCDWERWISYFLTGVHQEAQDVLKRIRRVRALQEAYRQILRERRDTGSSQALLEALFVNPFMTVPLASKILDMSSAGARRVLNRLVDAGIVYHVSETWPHFYIAGQLLNEMDGITDPDED